MCNLPLCHFSPGWPRWALHSWNGLLVRSGYVTLFNDRPKMGWCGFCHLSTTFTWLFFVLFRFCFFLHAQVPKSISKRAVVHARAANSRGVSWPFLCELRMSVDAWIRTCKAGLAQVLIGLVKHIRCSDFEMSLNPIIPWHYSQAHSPQWTACLFHTSLGGRGHNLCFWTFSRCLQVYSEVEGKWYWDANQALDIY